MSERAAQRLKRQNGRSVGLVPTNAIAKVTDFPHLTLSTARPQRDQLHPIDVEARQNKSSPSGVGALA